MRAAFLRLRVKVLRFFRQKQLSFLRIKPQKPLNFKVRMRTAILRLRVKVLRFLRQKELRFFEDKTSKPLKFRGEDEDSIFEEFYHPTLRGGVALFGMGHAEVVFWLCPVS